MSSRNAYAGNARGEIRAEAKVWRDALDRFTALTAKADKLRSIRDAL